MPSIAQTLSLGAAALSLFATGASAQSWKSIPPIEIYGQHFFYSNNGSQYYMKGVAYQQDYNGGGSTGGAKTKRADTKVTYVDPLADINSCKRDVPYMKQIFTNVIRVYAIDPTANHDECMELLASNDIYVVADMAAPDQSINSNDPTWNAGLYQRYTGVIDALAKYNNVIGFFAGNEVVESANQTESAAFVKAAVRDSKGYIKARGYRTSLGVGYATADVPVRDQLAAYFACEADNTGNATSIDFWGYNVYSWCGHSSFEKSSYDARVKFFKDYPVPVFFAEYGCIEGIDGGPTHRPFEEVAALYGDKMTDVFSGGIAYEWFMAERNYGLVKVDGNNVSPYPDFTSLQQQLKTVSPTITARSAYTPSNKAPACPTNDASWAPKASPLPPAVNPKFCDCEMSNFDCTIKSDDATKYGDIFGFICGADKSLCDGIAHNATTGTYGALGGCSPKVQLAWVANAYYQKNGKNKSACDFKGLAATQAPSADGSCSSLIQAAGTAGTGAVPSPTDAQGGSAASSSKNASPGGVGPDYFNVGKMLFGAYAIAAVVSALGIFIL
ncbi:Glucanosyltransferase-domain-containing protein [Apiospora arundinis]|uniref:1,3-beta-glucanosyltransferase n=1 Tax=Apiospora arundinis TaxID=335852 RepID=A0ABR2HL39_9PEZI